MIKVSIIVPVYNVKDYLALCLDSVLRQTLKEIEIICVNDGSTDGSGEILEAYAARDSRIMVIHQENGGYGKAMNVGMKAARGEYIGIVESDDCVQENMYEELYSAAAENKLDVVKSDYYKFAADCIVTAHRADLNQYYDKILEDKKLFFAFDMFNWTGIYRRTFLLEKGIWHYETPGASYQDTGFWLKVMCACEKAMWISKAFYRYRQDNMSCSTKSKDKMLNHKREYDWFEEETGQKEWIPIINFYRFNIYRFDFYRIDQTLREEYVRIIGKDYLERKNNIAADPVNPKRLDELKEWYEDLLAEPRQFLAREESEQGELRKRLEESKGIILYGTGNRGLYAYGRLKAQGYEKQLLFAVDSKPRREKFYQLDVYKPEKIKEYPEALVLISVCKGTWAYDEIEQAIKDMKVENYCDTETLTEPFS